MTNTNELACSYAALILTSGESEVTAEKISKLVKAAKVNVDSFWPNLFAKALSGVDIKNLVESAGSAAPAPAAAAAAAPAAETKAPAKEEKKEESEDEEDGDMGFGLFD